LLLKKNINLNLMAETKIKAFKNQKLWRSWLEKKPRLTRRNMASGI